MPGVARERPARAKGSHPGGPPRGLQPGRCLWSPPGSFREARRSQRRPPRRRAIADREEAAVRPFQEGTARRKLGIELALARPPRDKVRTGEPGTWERPNFAGGPAACVWASCKAPAPLPSLPCTPAATQPPAISCERWAGCGALCIPRFRVPRSPRRVALCVTDGAPGACEGTGVNFLLKRVCTFVQSLFRRTVRGTRKPSAPGRLRPRMGQSVCTPAQGSPSAAPGPWAPGFPNCSAPGPGPGNTHGISLSQ